MFELSFFAVVVGSIVTASAAYYFGNRDGRRRERAANANAAPLGFPVALKSIRPQVFHTRHELNPVMQDALNYPGGAREVLLRDLSNDMIRSLLASGALYVDQSADHVEMKLIAYHLDSAGLPTDITRNRPKVAPPADEAERARAVMWTGPDTPPGFFGRA